MAQKNKILDYSMELFSNKKKTEQIKILSEREIQNKLYGKYRKPHLDDGQITPPKRPQESKPEVITDEGLGGSDLFSPVPLKIEIPVENNPPKSVSVPSKNTEAQRIGKWMEQENRILKGPGATAPQRSPVSSGKSKASAFADSMSSAGVNLMKILGDGLAKLTDWFFDKVVQNPELIKKIPWLAGIVCIFLVLQSVHWLNIRREAAMKSPRMQEAQSAPVPEMIPAQVAATDVKKDTLTSRSSAETKPKEGAVLPPVEVKKAEAAALKNLAQNSPPVVKHPYVVQVATYINQEDAVSMSKNIQKEGFVSFVEALNRQSGRVYYCVFLGRYKTFSDAESQLTEFKKRDIAKPFQDAFTRVLS